MKAYWIPATQLEEWWPQISHLMQKAANTQQDWNLPGILARLKSEEWRLWIAYDEDAKEAKCALAAMIGQSDYGLKWCSMPFCVGQDLHAGWAELISEVEQWARNNQCSRMILQARPGWARVLKPAGYEVTHVVIEKDI